MKTAGDDIDKECLLFALAGIGPAAAEAIDDVASYLDKPHATTRIIAAIALLRLGAGADLVQKRVVPVFEKSMGNNFDRAESMDLALVGLQFLRRKVSL